MINNRLTVALVFGTTILYGCGGQNQKNSADEKSSGVATELSPGSRNDARWDGPNSPHLMDTYVGGQGYNYQFAELPTNGSLSNRPWSGGYWPTYEGGITNRWALGGASGAERYGYSLLTQSQIESEDLRYLSPAEKFDLLLGRYSFDYTRRERQRTQILRTVPGSSSYDPGYSIPRWEGLCHAWAPATLAFEEPKPITVRTGNGLIIPFGSSDIKALLTYFLHERDASTRFLAKRCNVDLDDLNARYRRGEISRSYYMSQRSACADTNAGAFHIVLANQVGLLNEGFIADVDREAEVWNQAVHRYTSRVVDTREGASSGAAPGTVKEVRVKTRMYYTQEIQYSWEQPTWQPNYYKDYDYWLELSATGEILGGEWASENADRPDFLWKQSTPAFTGDYAMLKRLYDLSIAQ